MAPKRIGMYWLGLLLISGFYCIYYVYFMYFLFYTMPPRQMRYIKFLFVVLAYGAGWLGLRKGTVPWAVLFWRFLYFFFLILLVGLGMYENFFTRLPVQVRIVSDNLVEFLVSPALYVTIGILSRMARSGVK
jgi:hypothetical protein